MARPIAKDYEDKRTAIVKQAAKFFAENGYDAASMRDLADACNISKALIYHYYISKEALLFDIIDRHLIDLLDAVSNAAETSDANADLQEKINTVLTVYRDSEPEHKLQLNSSDRLSTGQHELLKERQRQVVEIFADNIRRLRPDEFAAKPYMLKPVTMSIFGMLNWFYNWHHGDENAAPNSLSRNDYGNLVHGLVVGGIDKALAE